MGDNATFPGCSVPFRILNHFQALQVESVKKNARGKNGFVELSLLMRVFWNDLDHLQQLNLKYEVEFKAMILFLSMFLVSCNATLAISFSFNLLSFFYLQIF